MKTSVWPPLPEAWSRSTRQGFCYGMQSCCWKVCGEGERWVSTVVLVSQALALQSLLIWVSPPPVADSAIDSYNFCKVHSFFLGGLRRERKTFPEAILVESILFGLHLNVTSSRKLFHPSSRRSNCICSNSLLEESWVLSIRYRMHRSLTQTQLRDIEV